MCCADLVALSLRSYVADASTFSNRFMHLTNYSINRKNKAKFVKNTDPTRDNVGSKWSLRAVRERLAEDGVDVDDLWDRIEVRFCSCAAGQLRRCLLIRCVCFVGVSQDLIVKTMISVEPKVGHACRMFCPHEGNCFELYGFDVILDDKVNPHLLEVNLTPSLSCGSPLDLDIKVRVSMFMPCSVFLISI